MQATTQNITRCIPQMCRVINKYHWKSRPTDEKMLLLFTKGKTIIASPLKWYELLKFKIDGSEGAARTSVDVAYDIDELWHSMINISVTKTCWTVRYTGSFHAKTYAYIMGLDHRPTRKPAGLRVCIFVTAFYRIIRICVWFVFVCYVVLLGHTKYMLC